VNHVAFDALTRRASLTTLGIAGLAGVAGPLPSQAKKKRKKKKFDVNKFCKTQVSQCETFVTAECGQNPSPNCLAALTCCDELATCDFPGFVGCIQAVSQP